MEGEAARLLLTAGGPTSRRKQYRIRSPPTRRPGNSRRTSHRGIYLSSFALQLSSAPAAPPTGMLAIAGVEFVADPSGVLYWPEQGLLAVADLHFEKGSSFAARGVLLPP